MRAWFLRSRYAIPVRLMLVFCYIIPVSFILMYIDVIRQVDWRPGPLRIGKLYTWAIGGDTEEWWKTP